MRRRTPAKARVHRVKEGEGPAIDLVHLSRQTLGDTALEREVLQLFLRQSTLLLTSLRAPASANERVYAAHTLKGSARAVGAFGVARAAAALEADGESATLTLIEETVATANAMIARLLGD